MRLNAVIAILLMMSCDDARAKQEVTYPYEAPMLEEVSSIQRVDGLSAAQYFRDKQTGLCYLFFGGSKGLVGFGGMAQVPCEGLIATNQ